MNGERLGKFGILFIIATLAVGGSMKLGFSEVLGWLEWTGLVIFSSIAGVSLVMSMCYFIGGVTDYE